MSSFAYCCLIKKMIFGKYRNNYGCEISNEQLEQLSQIDYLIFIIVNGLNDTYNLTLTVTKIVTILFSIVILQYLNKTHH